MEHAGVLIDAQTAAAAEQRARARGSPSSSGRRTRRRAQPFNARIAEAAAGGAVRASCGCRCWRKTPTGQPSTAEDVLEELAENVRAAAHRSSTTARSPSSSPPTRTSCREQINPRTGACTRRYHQAVAATGRLSSTDPNLQNIPIRTPEGRRIRQAFVAPPGYVLLAADYSQIELRIMAHLSGDDGPAAARSPKSATSTRRRPRRCSACRSTQVSADQRRSAKAINFGLIYGMSRVRPRAAARHRAQRGAGATSTCISRAIPGVKRYMDETRAQARERGYVETVFGRRLYLPDINARNTQLRQARRARRHQRADAGHGGRHHQARDDRGGRLVTARDPARASSCRCTTSWCSKSQPRGRPRTRSRRVACSMMAGRPPCASPLRVDVGSGSNWDEAH